MNQSRTRIHVLSRRRVFAKPPDVRAAVSLHSHSECSRESLAFIPDLLRRIPIGRRLLEQGVTEYQREHGRPLDFAEWYWRPPAAPSDVIASEREHLRRRLGLQSFVSLTDHDTLEGPLALRGAGHGEIPLSLEWTVPYERSAFHLGIHGVRPAQVHELAAVFAAYTAGSPRAPRLADILDCLGESDHTLIVLNHPCWDIGRVGRLLHDSTLLAFLRTHRDRIHALELNGYRAWDENSRVLPLAQGFGIPVVGGGDRHGLTPNAIVNLTRAESFADFVHEIRADRTTDCVVFPEYTAPFVTRLLESTNDVLAPDRTGPGTRTWADRVFTQADGREQPVAAMWSRPPRWLDAAVWVTRLLAAPPVARVFEMTRADGHETLEADCGAITVFDSIREFRPDSAAA